MDERIIANCALIRIVNDIYHDKNFKNHKLKCFMQYLTLNSDEESLLFKQEITQLEYDCDLGFVMDKLFNNISNKKVCDIIIKYDKECVTLR